MIIIIIIIIIININIIINVEINLHHIEYVGVKRCTVINKSNEGTVFHGQEPPSGESTNTECGVNYQLLAVITEVAQWGTPCCSLPQPATDNGVRNGRSN